MRLHNFTICDLGQFRGQVHVDLDSVAAQLIAIWGTSGAGKTTMVELACLGAAYRQTATRGTLADLAQGRNSFVESTFTGADGVRFTVKQSYDAESGLGQSLLTGFDGKPLRNREGVPYLTSTGVKSYDAWAKEHLQAPAVYLASAFAAQEASRGLGTKGAMGLLTMSATERRNVVLRAQGAERYETHIETARKAANVASAVRDGLVARIADERAREGTVEAATTACSMAERAMVDAAERLVGATAAREALLPRIVAATEAKRAESEATKRRTGLEALRATAATAVAGLEERAANNRKLLADAVKIRAGVARAGVIDAELKVNAAARATHLAEQATSATSAAVADKELAVAKAAIAEANRRIAAATEDLKEREWAEETAPQMARLKAEAEAAEQACVAADAALDVERMATLSIADRRIGGLRDGLDAVARIEGHLAVDRYRDAVQGSVAATQRTDEAIRLSTDEAPARMQALIEAREAAHVAESTTKYAYGLTQNAVAMLPRIAAADVVMAEATAELTKATDAAKSAQFALDATSTEAVRVGDLIADGQRAAALFEKERAKLAGALKFVVNLDTAEARLAEIEPQVVTQRAELERLVTEIGSLPAIVPFDAPAEGSLADCDKSVADATRASMTAHAAVAVARDALERAEASKIRVEEMEVNCSAAEADVADWLLLIEGVRAVQADLADSAGPELSAIANDLLRTCYGPRFTLKISTVHTGAKGQDVEGYDLLVTDANNGREGDGSTYSPGERALIGAALADAVATLACRHAGLVGVGITLVRDECDAHLSAGFSSAWLAMVRRTAELCGASRTLIITHSVAVRDACDMVLALENGVVTFQEPGTL
jgi:exonuclease SbcC